MVSILCQHVIQQERVDILFYLNLNISGIKIHLWSLECRVKHFRFKDHFTQTMNQIIDWLHEEIQSSLNSSWFSSLLKDDDVKNVLPSSMEFKDAPSLLWSGWQEHYRYAINGDSSHSKSMWLGIKAKTQDNSRQFSLEGTSVTSTISVNVIKEFKQNLINLKNTLLEIHRQYTKSVRPLVVRGSIKLAPYHFRVVGDESCKSCMVSRRIGNYGTKGGWLVSAKVIFKKDEGEADLPEPLDDYLPCELLVGIMEGDLLKIEYSENITIVAFCRQRDESNGLDPINFEDMFLTNAKGDYGILEHNLFDSEETVHPLPKSEQYKYLEEFRKQLKVVTKKKTDPVHVVISKE